MQPTFWRFYMKFTCDVRTVKGQPDFKTEADAPNQGQAKVRAEQQARNNGLTPTGRTKAITVRD